jgi:hypothetical protein
VQFQYSIAGVTEIVLGSPAGGACPAATQGALFQLGERERIIAEITVKPGEGGRIFLRGHTLLSHDGNVVFQAGIKI